jgi:hypothetical protein
MCTMILETGGISGSGKGHKGWFTLGKVNVSYDHPFHVPLEHALNIDFVSESGGLDSRVAVELSPESAQELVKLITAALARGEVDMMLQETETGVGN